MTTALLLFDTQNDYFPGGAMALVEPEKAAAQAALLLGACRAKSLPIFHVQHLSTRAGATFFRPGSAGASIHASVAPRAGETLVTKNFPNAFRGTTLLDALRAAQATKLVVAGRMTHMCVDTTVRAAADLGFACALAQDACAARDLAFDGDTVAAPAVQLAYLAALNGAFASVQRAAQLQATL